METAVDLQPHTFNPDGVPAPPPTYNHVAITPLLSSSRLITLAGLTGCDPASSDNPKSLPEQASIAYTKIQACLAAAGATPRDIVQVKHYIVKDTGDPQVDQTDLVDRGWAELWVDFSESDFWRYLFVLKLPQVEMAGHMQIMTASPYDGLCDYMPQDTIVKYTSE